MKLYRQIFIIMTDLYVEVNPMDLKKLAVLELTRENKKTFFFPFVFTNCFILVRIAVEPTVDSIHPVFSFAFIYKR